MTTETFTLDDLKAHVAKQAGEDAAFRQALLADPKAAVEKLLQTDLPPQVKIQAIEEAPDTYVVVLPARPASGELSDADLENVAGGAGKSTDHRANAQLGASIVFGGLLGGSVMLLGATVKGLHSDSEAAGAKIKNTGLEMATCTPGMK